MDIAETLFQAHDRLAIRRKAEMSRLDDARMNRPDSDLMQAITLRYAETPIGTISSLNRF